ncbi:HD-GYP domain-containing protein [Cellvibrio sp. PSBB023]|uniref:HD-GYP domain-containing protein n=1 Tax=Cellvibrio sp. PSBB023 TaxID=1945512 RepID=UPI00098F0CDA|nr:HD-GYP domain-containing protein [Cellvibrio sp. PSBB023]AQT60639.1 diguanylate cyclase [Cellvibrio sp. PSBB023]
MAIKQVKVDVNELTIGMYVSGLDRPWSQTPFPLQGFYLRDLGEINQLKALCHYVYIDVEKGRGPISANLKTIAAPTKKTTTRERVNSFTETLAPLKIQRGLYRDVTPLQREVKQARQLHQKVYGAVVEVMEQLEKNQFDDLSLGETKRVASEMVDSVVRNPDAFTWLSRVQEKDEYTYSHAVRSSVWAILFGRHIGLPKRDLDVLAMGVLLKDVGKVMLDAALITNLDRSAEEEALYESFVELGCEILRKTQGVEPRVIAVVKTHCERLNGTGFPHGLSGDKIPLLGKIAGIVTYYDHVTNPRGSRDPIAPSKAVAKLYELRNIQFQEELVVEFIRAIGLYPTGTLVELSTGEVAVVVEQNFERRLKPKVIVVLDTLKQPLSEYLLLDLAEDDKRKQELIDTGKKSRHEIEKIEIARDLEPGSYDVDIAGIRDHYLMKHEKKGLMALLSRLTTRN